MEIFVNVFFSFFLSLSVDVLKINCRAVANMRRYLLVCVKILVAFLAIIY